MTKRTSSTGTTLVPERRRVGSGRHGRLVGATVGGVFGSVWLIAGADTPLGSGAATAVRIVGIVGIVVLLGAQRGFRRRADAAPARPDTQVDLFGRAYWQIVAGEVAALAVGSAAFAAAGAPTEIYRPWTALIVAFHFVAFHRAGVWQGNPIWPVVPLLAVGVAGFALAFTADADWASLVSGIGSGVILLSGSLRVIVREFAATRVPATEPTHELSA